jgi:hypothetical protein
MPRTQPADHLSSHPPLTPEGSPQWPGERHPTRWDVHDANESLASTFRERFKTLLLHSEDAQNCRPLIPSLEHHEDHTAHDNNALRASVTGSDGTGDLQAALVS